LASGVVGVNMAAERPQRRLGLSIDLEAQ
jgi:hypothetical protein